MIVYLSRLILDDQKRETQRLLSSPEFVHGAVEQCFPGKRDRNLWRIDYLNGQCCLLVLSHQLPDFGQLVSAYGFKDRQPPWESKPYDNLLNRLENGQVWRFRLKANPVRSLKQEGDDRGKVTAHVTPEHQKHWLFQRAEKEGFSLSMDAFEVVHTQWLRFYKGGNRLVTLRTATFEGVLKVTDAAALKESLQTGLGRAKAYGCGLMTLAKAGVPSDV